jgi:hypothetical protein
MQEPGNKKTAVWWGIFGGMGAGVALVILYYFYLQVTDPSPYDVVYLLGIPLAATIGAIIGLFLAAWRASDSS